MFRKRNGVQLASKDSVELRSNQHSDKTWSNGKRFTMQFTRWQRFRVLTILGIVGIGSLALIYFIPAPPSKVVKATAFKGASFEYYGRQYQDIFARSHVELELRETAGAVENLKLLQDPNSDVQIAFVTGLGVWGRNYEDLLDRLKAAAGNLFRARGKTVTDMKIIPSERPALQVFH